MNILNIDFKSLLPSAIEVFTNIYGEEYRSIITERVNNALILSYLDPDGINNYASFLKRCKRKEFAIELLSRIGIDTEPYKKENYTDSGYEIEKLLDPYIDGSYLGMDSSSANYWAPLRAFDPNNVDLENSYHEKQLLKNRIELINHLRGEDKEKLTVETFSAFIETEEYNKLLEKINEWRAIHNELLAQCSEWEKCVEPYEEYSRNEQNRKKEILQKKKDELFDEVFSDILDSVKMAMEGKTPKEQQEMFFMSADVSSRFNLESFRKERMDALLSPKVSSSDKSWFIIYQRWYLESVGIKVPEASVGELETPEGIAKHLDFLKQEDIRGYIPSEDLISRITSIREKKYEEGLKEYYTTRTDFIEIMKIFNNNPDVVELIYDNIKKQRVFINGSGGSRDGEFIAIMFYTPNSNGHLFGSLLHELEHVIDQTKNGCGFEPIETFANPPLISNPYDKDFRKYEKFNETINDMLKNEAVEFFQNQGIYHIESKEFVQLDISNHNTGAVTKDLLKPLLQSFRQQVIKAKIKVDQTELTRYIGTDNFEELVDAVNKVDYLSRNGFVPKIKESPEDPMVIEYQEQVARVEQVYLNINAYNNQLMAVPSINPSDSQIVSGRKR